MLRALLDDGMAVDTRGWSNFTPLDQAAMNGRTETVRLLMERGSDLHDCAFDDEGPTPLDCALWGLRNNRAEDGDYPGTVALLLAADAPTRQSPPVGDEGLRSWFGSSKPALPNIAVPRASPCFSSGSHRPHVAPTVSGWHTAGRPPKFRSADPRLPLPARRPVTVTFVPLPVFRPAGHSWCVVMSGRCGG